MSFSRSWMVLTIVWGATSILLAQIIADAIWNDEFATAVFIWFLLISSALIPLGHEFIHPQRPYRQVILVGAMTIAALFAVVLYMRRDIEGIFWIPLIWACVLGFSDWLFIKAQSKSASSSPTNETVNERLRDHAYKNIDRAIHGFDANAVEFQKVFLDEQTQEASDVQFGSITLNDAKDFLGKKFGHEAALAAFFIVFQRVYDEPRKSQVYMQLRLHLSKNFDQSPLPDQNGRQPILTDADIQNVWELVVDPRYSSKNDELRLAIAMAGLFAGTRLKPPLAADKDRETLMLLVKRTLNRMRNCLQR